MEINYPQLRHYFNVLLSNESDLSSSQVIHILNAELNNAERRSSLEEELTSILADSTINWREWLSNSEYEIDDNPKDYMVFRNIILSIFWSATFPNVSPPPVPNAFS